MDNHVNHENLRIQFENNENYENQIIPQENNKNTWKSCYSSRDSWKIKKNTIP